MKSNRFILVSLTLALTFCGGGGGNGVNTPSQDTQVIGPQGGRISVQNHLADTITLEIPPLALSGSTSISMTTLDSPPQNPIAQNIFPGVILEPSGIIFSTPIKIKVNFHNALSNPDLAMLFWLNDSNLASPILNQTATQNSIEGETTHFSKIIGGEPSADEIWSQIVQILVSGRDTSALGILYTIDDYLDIMKYAKMLRVLANDQKADDAENSARGMLEERSLEILSSTLPDNPCGQYSNVITQLRDLIKSALGDTALSEQIGKRSCTISITPQNIILYQGDSLSLTKELIDPNGNQRSCSSLNWYSSNLNVVEITSTTNDTCTVTAVSLGNVNISANCDGLLGSASVVVNKPSALTVSVSAETRNVCSNFSQTFDLTGAPPPQYLNTCQYCTTNACFTYSQQSVVSGRIDSGTVQIHITGTAQTDASCFAQIGDSAGNILQILVGVVATPPTPLTYTITGSVDLSPPHTGYYWTDGYPDYIMSGDAYGMLSCTNWTTIYVSDTHQSIALSGTWPCDNLLGLFVNAIAGCSTHLYPSQSASMDLLVTVQMAAP